MLQSEQRQVQVQMKEPHGYGSYHAQFVRPMTAFKVFLGSEAE